jgi:hypothetical protein
MDLTRATKDCSLGAAIIAHSREPQRNVMLIAELELPRGTLTRTGTKVSLSRGKLVDFDLRCN